MREHTERYVAGAVVVVAVAIGLMVGKPSPPSTVASAVPVPVGDTASSSVDDPTLTVHVSGQVLAAGLVRLAADARVADAVAAAGGVTAEADLARINLAAPVNDGQQIVVPARGDLSDPAISGGVDARVRINTADAVALEVLPGVGPVLAAKIVAHREEFGSFETVEDLLGVPGIGEQKLAAFRDLVIVP